MTHDSPLTTMRQQITDMNEVQLLALSNEVLRGHHDVSLAREGLTWQDAHKLIEQELGIRQCANSTMCQCKPINELSNYQIR